MVTNSQSGIHSRDIGAIALFGGRGDRLLVPTWNRTKPAVRSANTILGAYSTSNAKNSNIPWVALATQYRPYSLRRFYSDVYGNQCGPGRMIDPVSPLDTSDDPFYNGTADAFEQVLQLAKRRDPKYILGLSGDHIYAMNFAQLYDAVSEIQPRADFVIVSQTVPRSQATQLGILVTQGTKVVDFKEKPKEEQLPKDKQNFQANMGIYFAPTETWETVLREVRKSVTGEFDIGKHVIPYLLEAGYNLHTFTFDGYWRDVGTPHAFWEAHRDICIRRNPDLLSDRAWPIEALSQPQFHHDGETYFTTGRFECSHSKLDGSVFSNGVHILNSEAIDSILFGGECPPTVIEGGSILHRVIMDKGVHLHKGVKLIAEGDALIMVAKGMQLPSGSEVKVESGVGIVAPLSELVRNSPSLFKYSERVSPDIRLYTLMQDKLQEFPLGSLPK